MSDYIPHELVIEVLTRLPVKSLLRFMSVCKSWYSLITNPSFITAHLNQTIASNKKQNQTLFLRYYDKNDKKEHYTLRREDETFFGDQFSELEFPFKSGIGYFRIVGSCNGLLCLSDDLFGDSQTVILWNPSNRKSMTLRMPSKQQRPHMFVLGFGFCPVSQDFKVVRILYYKDLSYSYTGPSNVEIYTLSTGTWRSAIWTLPPYCMLEFKWSQAFVNGALHWIAYEKRAESGNHNLIVVFDLCDEVFWEMMLPCTLAGEPVMNLSVTVLGDSLTVLQYSEVTEQIQTVSCSIWVMRQYGVTESWTKLFTIDLPGKLKKIVGFRKSGEVILSLRDNELVSYDPNTGQTKDLGILGNIRSFYVDTYMETLILLKGRATGFL